MYVKIPLTRLFVAYLVLEILAERKGNHADRSDFFARREWTPEEAYEVVWGLIGLILYVRDHPGPYCGSGRRYQDPIQGQTSPKLQNPGMIRDQGQL